MESAGLDGLDIDWEYPGDHDVTTANTQRDWHAYGLLMRDLAAAFFDKGYVLSFCTNLGYQMAPSGYYAAFHAADYINAMAYGGQKLNASPQVMMTGINVCTSRGVPSRRIVVGQAMYAYENGNPGWASVVNWLNLAWPYDLARRWDADLVMRDGTTKETFEGPASFHAKCNWCRANGYGGVMSWGYFTDVAWNDASLMSLARHQSKACWPRTCWSWPTPPQDADGTYLLDSEEDWFWLRDNPGANARLSADITLSHDPLPIESFSGTIDGAGHTLTIPRDVWLAYDSKPALIRSLAGTVKDLKIDLRGRVVNRASRWNDTTADASADTMSLTDATEHATAVLAAQVRGGAVIDNVELVIRKGAEVQGPTYVAGIAANVWTVEGSRAAIRNCRVQVGGVIRSLARNTAEANLSPGNATAGGLAGWVGCPGDKGIEISGNTVVMESTGRIAVETGTTTAAGVIAGHVNNAYPVLDANTAYISQGAALENLNITAADNLRRSHGAASWLSPSGDNLSETTIIREDGVANLTQSCGGLAKGDARACVLTAVPQSDGTHIEISGVANAAIGRPVSITVVNSGNDDAAISVKAKPLVRFFSYGDDGLFCVEAVRPERSAVENGILKLHVPEPSTPLNPFLFSVQLTP